MKSNYKKLPKFVVKFANTVFSLAIFFSFLITLYIAFKVYNQPDTLTSTFYYVCILFFILIATLFSFGLKKLNIDLKVNVALIFLTLVITVYGFEMYLTFWPQYKMINNSSDTRNKMEVIEDFLDLGIKAYPAAPPSLHIKSLKFNVPDSMIYTLGTISNTTTVLCSEGGDWSIYESDEHGFNNPKGLYSLEKRKFFAYVRHDC